MGPMNEDIDDVCGQCHCGGVRFEARLSDGLRSAIRCTCKFFVCRDMRAIRWFHLISYRSIAGCAGR
jgi:hypothetical protein